MIAAKLGEFYAAHPSVDRSVLPANKKLEYLCGHADARGRLKFQPDPNVSGGGWLEIVTSPEPTFSPSTDTASMAAFHIVLGDWIHARGGRVHAAGIGPFYVEHPEFEEFKGKWKPSRHCMRDGCLVWEGDEDAPGKGWIQVATRFGRVIAMAPVSQYTADEVRLHYNSLLWSARTASEASHVWCWPRPWP